MISFGVSGARFTYRVAGVCIHDGHVLTHKSDMDDFYALPGGRVEIMESSEDALRREMREELGVGIRIERLLWIIENLFTYEGHASHELGLYYLMSLDGADSFYDKSKAIRCLDAPHLTLQWLPLAELRSFKVLPTLLTSRLFDLPSTPQRILHEDYESTAG